jgi:hypothetical protein
MLRLLLPLLLLLLGLGGGVGAGLMLGGGGDATPEDHAAADDHAAPEDDHGDGGDHAEADDHGGAPAAGTEFVRLNNQFVVPIIRSGSVRSLVVMSLTLEIDSGNNEAVFDREPRLRDSFLQVMFAHANAGGFDGSFTEATAMDPLRAALGDAARQVLGDILSDVLIVDITRQDA